MRVLLAGFGRFPGASFNPSATLVHKLASRRRPALARLTRSAHVFATEYACVDRELPALFAAKPDIVLMFGLAGRRREVCVETRARNAVSVLFPDASGHRPTSGTIESGAMTARVGRAPFVRLVGALRTANVPARLSRDAGRYLCNYAYWRALQWATTRGPLVQFVHIPPVAGTRRPRRRNGGQDQHRRPSLDQLVAAAERLLIAAVAARVAL
jgi:pyroglutamyl-peptidase